MAVVLITAVERSALAVSAPEADAIARAFRAGRLGPRAADGDWIGPAPRITRTATIGERFKTTTAWLYGLPAGPPWQPRPMLRELAENLAARVTAELGRVTSGWEPARAVVWSEAVNGAVAWWADGFAAVTRTRDEFPTGGGRFDASENPWGPTTAGTHPSTVGEVGRRAVRELRRGRGVGGVVMLVGGVLLGARLFGGSGR